MESGETFNGLCGRQFGAYGLRTCKLRDVIAELTLAHRTGWPTWIGAVGVLHMNTGGDR